MASSLHRVVLLSWTLLCIHAAVSAESTPTPGAVAVPTDASSATPAATIAPAPPPNAVEPEHFDLSRPEIRGFIDQLVAQGLDRDQLTAVLSAAEPQGKIIDAMNRPVEKTMQWWEYRARMLTDARIGAGVQLWHEHKELLDQIALEYQVPPEYLIAVLGVETQYGRLTGRYRVVDALATLGFDFPPRANYFRKELGEYLLLAHEQGFEPLSIRGSYAGAMGALQFMPSSYRKYAVSATHAGSSDLWNDWGDIFASTANYLHRYGWQYGAPVLAEAQLSGDQSPTPAERMALNETLGGLRVRGLSVASPLPDTTPALLLAAPAQDAMAYRVGFQNFYVLTRYNSSPLYAMAVHDLAEAIRQQIAQESAL